MSDALDTLKRQFEKIAKEINPIMLEHRAHDKSKQWSDLYYTHPNSTQAGTVVKRIAALARVDALLAGLLMPVANRLMLKQGEIMVQKDADLKARNDRKAAAQSKRDEKAEVKRNPYHRLDPVVADILRQVAEPYRVQAVEMETLRLTNVLEEVKRLSAMFNSFDPYVLFPYKRDNAYANAANSFKRLEANKFIKCTSANFENTWSLKSNTEAVIAEKAAEFANDMVIAFVHKTGMKLSGMVEKKKGAHKVTISGNSLQSHWMHFTFEDGASFDVQSQVVWKTSVNGVHFPQFPTCFRNVKLSNGSKLELPSESKMKEQFV